MENSTVLLKSARFRCKEIKPQEGETTTDRQEKVQGYKQEIMNGLTVSLIGAGGLGGEIARGLVRKGVGRLKIFDGDTVEISNLSRQYFYEDDLYKNKAICLAQNLVKEGIRKTEIIGYPFMFQGAVEEKIDTSCNIGVCAPDNDEARIFISKYFRTTPVVYTGLDRQANTGYIFIQEPGKANFLDLFPESVNKKRNPCPGTPAIIDIVKIVAGYILFAIDSVVMERKRNWNYRQFYLAGFVPEVVKKIGKRDVL
ncbi:MAG: ThiF family adenylyltransferase [Candidatus Omnitrophica bacterium]|nr:ThiF family adenylyltransferase [Candidatus Omnitrophota bacterium]